MRIVTHGRQARAFTAIVSAVNDEARFRADDDGLHCTVVNPGNTVSVDVTLPQATCSSLDPDGGPFGVPIGWLERGLRYARVGSGNGDNGDRVELSFGPDRALVTVERLDADGDTDAQRETGWFHIPHEAVREEPNIPDLDLPAQAAVTDTSRVVEAVREFDCDSVWVAATPRESGEGHALRLAGTSHDDWGGLDELDDEDAGTMTGDAFTFPKVGVDVDDDRTDEARAGSLFSAGRLADVAGALDAARMDRATLRWGDEFPMEVQFTMTSTGVNGEFMLAPRIPDTDASAKGAVVSLYADSVGSESGKKEAAEASQ